MPMSVIPFPRSGNSGRSPGRLSPSAAGESDLVPRIAAGDESALDELIEQFWVPLTSYSSRILDDMAAAEDVVQVVFVRVWQGRREWDPRSTAACLFRMTRNLSIDELRSRKARRDREVRRTREFRRDPPTPDAALEEDEVAAAVDAAIQALPPRRREAFVLSHVQGLSYSEVAEVMCVSTKTVGNHISAALAELRRALRPFMQEVSTKSR